MFSGEMERFAIDSLYPLAEFRAEKREENILHSSALMAAFTQKVAMRLNMVMLLMVDVWFKLVWRYSILASLLSFPLTSLDTHFQLFPTILPFFFQTFILKSSSP